MTNDLATIPPGVLREITRRVARLDELQATRRFVTRSHGRWHWSECSRPGRGYDADATHERRVSAAAAVREARRLLRENGYNPARVCAAVRGR